MSRARKITVVALLVAIIGCCWKGRYALFYMWATWRESRSDN